MEQKLIEEQTAKRIEETVNQRVQEELDKRKDEIENEVLRRIEEAKKAMEAEMMKEIEKRRLELLEEEQKREVGNHFNIETSLFLDIKYMSKVQAMCLLLHTSSSDLASICTYQQFSSWTVYIAPVLHSRKVRLISQETSKNQNLVKMKITSTPKTKSLLSFEGHI